MRNSATPDFIPEVFIQENSAKQNDQVSESVSNMDTKKGEFENEPEKPKAAAEKGAKQMQQIWGDKFLSDSLH